MTTLIASEIELMGEFDEVQQLDKKPSGWGSSCMSSSSCLRSIAKKYGAQAVVGGSVSKRSDRYDIKLVYFDNGKIVRTESTKLEISPMAVADGLATYARFVVTGVDPEAKKKEARVEGFEAGGVDFLDEEEEDDTPLVLAPTVSRRIATPPSSSRLTDDFEDPDERGGYAPARTPPPPPAPAEDPDEDFEFGSATDDIEVEDVTFGSATSLIEVEEPAPAPRRTYAEPAPRQSYRSYDDEDPEGDSPRSYDDLDEPEPQPRPTRTARSRPERSVSVRRPQTASNSNAGSLGLTGRLGFSNFQSLNFLTYGLEGAFQVQDTLALVIGLEAYSVRRTLPPELVPVGQPAVQWNTILPFNVGMLYKPSASDIRPYVGAGMQLIPGYVKSTGAMAFGFRARGGVDFIIADNFGLNLNAAAGMWSGEYFGEVQEDLQPTGLVPQISGGTVFLF